MTCPCGSGLELDACCNRYIVGGQKPETAEALMRSRYTAYATKQVDYILDTHDPKRRDDLDPAATKEWADRTEWLGLEVLGTQAGGSQDERGEVEFKARFRDERGREYEHHERSTFVRREGRWYFEDGEVQKPPPVTRGPKIGRNDPCPCGSGKKHKKCCGRA